MNALRLNLFRVGNKDNVVSKNENKQINNNLSGGKVMKKEVSIEGMMCAHCEGSVKKAFEKLDKVSSADVSHATGKAILDLKEDMTADEAKAVVEEAGYKFVGMA